MYKTTGNLRCKVRLVESVEDKRVIMVGHVADISILFFVRRLELGIDFHRPFI